MNKNNELIQLDSELLNGYLQSLGLDVVKQMFALYSQQGVIYLDDIENALLSGSEQLWQEHCHKMKGAAGSVGLTALHARLKLMEKTTAQMNEKAQQLVELKVHNHQALSSFKSWLAAVE